MVVDEVRNLGVKERIILMNDIWESLESENATIESPPWHKKVLEERMNKVQKNTAKFISLEDLKANKLI